MPTEAYQAPSPASTMMEREAGQQGGSGKTTSDQKNASEPGVNSDPENFSVDWGHLSYRRADGRMFYRRTNRGTGGTSGESGAGKSHKVSKPYRQRRRSETTVLGSEAWGRNPSLSDIPPRGQSVVTGFGGNDGHGGTDQNYNGTTSSSDSRKTYPPEEDTEMGDALCDPESKKDFPGVDNTTLGFSSLRLK